MKSIKYDKDAKLLVISQHYICVYLLRESINVEYFPDVKNRLGVEQEKEREILIW